MKKFYGAVQWCKSDNLNKPDLHFDIYKFISIVFSLFSFFLLYFVILARIGLKIIPRGWSCDKKKKKTEPAGTGQAHNFDSTVSKKIKTAVFNLRSDSSN